MKQIAVLIELHVLSLRKTVAMVTWHILVSSSGSKMLICIFIPSNRMIIDVQSNIPYRWKVSFYNFVSEASQDESSKGKIFNQKTYTYSCKCIWEWSSSNLIMEKISRHSLYWALNNQFHSDALIFRRLDISRNHAHFSFWNFCNSVDQEGCIRYSYTKKFAISIKFTLYLRSSIRPTLLITKNWFFSARKNRDVCHYLTHGKETFLGICSFVTPI